MTTVLRLAPTVEEDAGQPGLGRVLRAPVIAGAVVVALFFGGFVGWAAWAPLAGAAIAPGVVSPDGSRKTVQHLEGGIIREILVRDGDLVTAGQPLMVLEGIQATAAFEQVESQYLSLAATRARLLAEQAGETAIAFPDDLLDRAADPQVAQILQSQLDQFASRREVLDTQRAILGQRIAQLGEEIAGLEAQIASQEQQLALIADEIADVDQLVGQGLERRTRLRGLQRAQAQIGGNMAENRSAIARARQAIGEAELEIISLETTRRDETANQLVDLQLRLAMLEEQRRASGDILARTAIAAPVDGTVVQLRFKTVGGVVAPGSPILDIVPLEDELVIDAQVSPADIDVVHAGLTAQVHLTAYRQRELPRIDGVVQTVSADALVDQTTGQPYFLARVEVDRAQLQEIAPDLALVPGMPAEVMIATGERTALDYLLRPLTDSIRRSFREN